MVPAAEPYRATPADVGFPLGEPVLLLRAIPDPRDVDVVCSVDNAQGRQLAVIAPRSRMSAWSSDTDDLVFDVMRPDGILLHTINRLGGLLKHHRLLVYDGGGRPLGELRQTSSPWRRLRGGRISMTMSYGGRELAHAEVCIYPRRRFLDVSEPIRDTAGVTVAVVQRKWRYGDSNDFFDYRLECGHGTARPLPSLLLATAFAHYLYDRLAVGGPFESYNRFGRGGTWHDAHR